MSDYIDRFTAFLESAERSTFTIKNYLYDLSDFADWFEQTNGDLLEPVKITPTDLRDYKRHLLVQRFLKPSSVNRKLAALRSFIKWASDAGLLTDERMLRVPKFEREERLGLRWLDRREQNALLRVVERGKNLRDIAIIKILLNTGLRIRELCELTWQDVTLSERKGTLTVRRGKGGKYRSIPLNKDARMAFLGIGYQEHAGEKSPIFIGQRGPMTERGVQFLFKGYAKKAGLDSASPHTLRHTFCKNLVNAGVSLETIATLVGHENLEITRRYCEPSFNDLINVVEMISEEE